MTFKTKNVSIHPSKPNIILYDKGNVLEYSHVYGTSRILFDELKDQYNIILFGTRLFDDSIKNQVVIDKNFVSKEYDRASHNSNSKEDNLKRFNNDLSKLFQELNISTVDYFIGAADTHFQLPFTSYVPKKYGNSFHDLKNTFFDSVSEDENLLNEIHSHTNRVCSKLNQYINLLAFSSTYSYVGFFLPLYLHAAKMLKHKCLFFSVDPTLFSPFFLYHNIPAKFLYFADDNRGTRRFEQFDIAQFQHIVYEPKYLSTSLFEPQRSKDLLFYGTIFQEKGPRRDMYYQFLHNLRNENSSLYIPFYKNKSVINKSVEKKFKHLDLDEFGNLYADVSHHPLVEKQKTLRPLDIPNELKMHKYNLILRCVSPEDSLNFRPIVSVLYDNLPLIDHMYDPCNLQIPQELNDALIVRNSDDVEQKIHYYNKHESERIQILDRLKQHFRVNEYLENSDLMVKKEIQRIIPEFAF